jgi:hypothetical protein
VRGSLPVGPLNRVLEEFRQWRQPTLMLVGNHDQVPILLEFPAVVVPVSVLISSDTLHSEDMHEFGLTLGRLHTVCVHYLSGTQNRAMRVFA